MDTYSTKQEKTVINGVPYFIKTLKDRTQFSDPNGAAESLGISSAMWPISGMLWPSSIVLAEVVSKLSLTNLRVLEVGCGIGLASLVAASKGANITASDYHPLTPTLLRDNAALNDLPSIRYFKGDWRKPITGMGVFDLIIGSDLLYVSENSEILATFINCHLAKNGEVIMIDPCRKQANKFIKKMSTLHLDCTEKIQLQSDRPEKLQQFNCYTFKRLHVAEYKN